MLVEQFMLKKAAFKFWNACFKKTRHGDMVGATYISDNSKITIINSSFIKNGYGGAIYANDTSLFITSSNFIENTGEEGGAVRWMTYEGTVTIEGCNFTGNVAGHSGGALLWVSIDTILVKIINCSFVYNRIPASYAGSGGALHLTNINTI